MPKKDTTTPSPPSERPAPKTMTIDLTPNVAVKLRKLSARTGLTQAHLRGELSRSREVEAAIEAALKQIYADWLEDTGDIFGPPEKGAPDA